MEKSPEKTPLTTDPTEMLERLNAAMVAGCTCMTKTPEIVWHDPTCHYRLFFEAGSFVFAWRKLKERCDELEDQVDWLEKGNKEYQQLLASVRGDLEQAHLERDGYKYRLESLNKAKKSDWSGS